MNSKKETKKRIVKRLVFEISLEKHRDIKLAATQMGLTMKDFIDIAIKEKIEKEKTNE